MVGCHGWDALADGLPADCLVWTVLDKAHSKGKKKKKAGGFGADASPGKATSGKAAAGARPTMS